MTIIVVPVKALRQAKQRLAGVLTREQRRLLAEAMLRDVAAALRDLQRKVRIAFVTSDSTAIAIAHGIGFEVISDSANSGETDAISIATEVAVRSGAHRLLVIPGDVPLVTAAEIEAILDAAPPRGTVLVPALDGRGTNAILRTPPDLFPARFGNDSFQPHLEGARRSGGAVVILHLPAIAVDVDNPADLERVTSAGGNGRTRRLLSRWSATAKPAMASS